MPDKTIKLDRKVPEFPLAATGGELWKLSGAAGRKLVVYFYPKDNTSGCTAEGIEFRDLYPKFRRAGTDIVGVSPDTPPSHDKFKAKYQFPFDLLADVDRKTCLLFDVIREKSMYGRKFMGVERSTFLLDENGVLRREWRKVKVAGHPPPVLDAAREL